MKSSAGHQCSCQCEQQFITTLSVHKIRMMVLGLKEHLKSGFTPRTITADSALVQKRIINYWKSGNKKLLKYNTFIGNQTLKYKSNIFLKENFPYDAATGGPRIVVHVTEF